MQNDDRQESSVEMKTPIHLIDTAEVARLEEGRLQKEKADAAMLERRLHRIEVRLGLVAR